MDLLLLLASVRIIDPKAQFETMIANLLVRGITPGGKPWKRILRHMADQT
jgi:hypothetical protein